MSSMPTPNYVLNKSHKIYRSYGNDPVTLVAGTFVRPIEECYLPKHITDSDAFLGFNPETEVYVYCRIGIIRIPLEIMRRV